MACLNDQVGFHAETTTDLIAAFREEVDDYLEACATIGQAPEKPYSGQLMVRVDPAVHAKVALAAESAGQSLARWTEESLRTAADADVAAAVAV